MRKILLVLSLGLAAVAHAHEADECAPARVALAMVHNVMPIQQVIAVDAEATPRVVAWFNALEPVSDTPYDAAVVIRHANGRIGVSVGWKDKGTLCESMPISRELVPALMKAIAGEPKA